MFAPGNTNNIVNDGIACVGDGYVIYNENKHLVLKSLNSGETKQLSYDGYFLNIRFPYVFFALKPDGFSLYRYNITSGEHFRIVKGEVKWVQVVADKVYYTLDANNYLYLYDIATGTTKLTLRQDSNYLCVVGDKIYFSNWSCGKTLWEYNTVDDEAHKILDKDVAWINVIDEDTLVFRSWHNRKTYTLHIPTRSCNMLNADGANYLHYRDGFIYYANKRLGGLWRQSVLDKRNKSCIWSTSVRRINTIDNVLFFQDENKQLVRLSTPKIKVLPRLRYIEMIVTTECNAQCMNCSNGIPYAKRRTISYEDFRGQLQLLLSNVALIERFQIHGGEPFLNPDLHRIISLVNISPKLLNIRIATNGTLIPDEKIILALRGSRIVLAISSYQFNRVTRERLVAICKNNNIRHILYDEQKWYCFDSSHKGHNRFASCPINFYPCYYDNKIYLCSRICHLYGEQYPHCYISLKDFHGDLVSAMADDGLKAPCCECTISSQKIQAGT